MLNKIQAIINKVREIAQYNPEIKEIVKDGNVSAEIRVDKQGTPFLSTVTFAYYSKLVVAATQLFIVPEYGSRKIVMRYNSFDEFIGTNEPEMITLPKKDIAGMLEYLNEVYEHIDSEEATESLRPGYEQLVEPIAKQVFNV